MIKLIIGKKGSGKTKRIIDMVNKDAVESSGNVVFIDDDKRYMYDVKHEVRFIDASEYSIDSKERLFGFLNGILATNFDISAIYIDAFMKIVDDKPENLEEFFAQLEKMLKKSSDASLVLNISAEVAPEFMKPYAI